MPPDVAALVRLCEICIRAGVPLVATHKRFEDMQSVRRCTAQLFGRQGGPKVRGTEQSGTAHVNPTELRDWLFKKFPAPVV